MSTTWEHLSSRWPSSRASAAYHYNEAAKYDQAEEHERAVHHAYLAQAHNQQAIHHDAEAAKLHAEHCDVPATPASKQATEKESAA